MNEIHVTTDESMMEVIIDRPKANAIDAATSRSLGEAFSMFRDDPGLSVAIITAPATAFLARDGISRRLPKVRNMSPTTESAGLAVSPSFPGSTSP